MEMTKLEKNYLIDVRAETAITQHGSIDNAIKYLEKELEENQNLWGRYSCDCLGHGITCTSLLIDWLKRQKDDKIAA